ncbi:MAG: site-specific integrase [Candidatus Thermoplasmatota archaeon]
MENKVVIYQYEKYIKKKLKKIKEDKEISKHNKVKILEFKRYCRAQGIGSARILRYLNDLPQLAIILKKNFEKAEREDIEKVLHTIENSNYAPRTKLDFKITIKKFYKWINGGEEYPQSVKWIKTGGKNNNNKIPEELITEEEVKKMIQNAIHPRDRAIISVLWESGIRVGELLLLQLKHIAFEERLTRITVQGKTGMRRIPLIDSTPYLAEWINNHPFKDDPNAQLWIGIGTVGRNKPLEYASVRKLLMEIAKKSGTKKKVNPHNFRHSRATFLAKHFTEAQMKEYLGWVPGSDMAATYVHLSGRDVDDAVLKMRGLKPEEEKVESTLAPKKCPRCTLINKATGKFCTRCGSVLDLDTAMKMQDEIKDMDEKFSRLLQDKEIQELLLKKIVKLGIK